MIDRTPIRPSGLDEPKAPYSYGLKVGDFIFVSGQVSNDLTTGELVGEGDIRAQTRQVLANIGVVVNAAGASLDRLVKTTVFLTDISDFEEMNEAYRDVVPAPRPARSTVQAALANSAFLVEIEAICLA